MELHITYPGTKSRGKVRRDWVLKGYCKFILIYMFIFYKFVNSLIRTAQQRHTTQTPMARHKFSSGWKCYHEDVITIRPGGVFVTRCHEWAVRTIRRIFGFFSS